MSTLDTIINFTFFGNTMFQIFMFVLMLILFYPLSKISIYIINKILLKWAGKSNSKLDDILVKSLDPTISMFVLAGLFYIGSNFLNQGIYTQVFSKIFNFLIIIPIVFFLTKFTTEIISYYLKGEKKSTKINEAGIDLLMQIVRIGLFIIGIILVLANLGYDISALIAGLGVGGLAFALAAKDTEKIKLSVYECGPEVTKQPNRISPQFYLFALLFLLFDVEIVFMFPWAVDFKLLGWFGFAEMLMFILLLAIGFVYAWKKGALEWHNIK